MPTPWSEAPSVDVQIVHVRRRRVPLALVFVSLLSGALTAGVALWVA